MLLELDQDAGAVDELELGAARVASTEARAMTTPKTWSDLPSTPRGVARTIPGVPFGSIDRSGRRPRPGIDVEEFTWPPASERAAIERAEMADAIGRAELERQRAIRARAHHGPIELRGRVSKRFDWETALGIAAVVMLFAAAVAYVRRRRAASSLEAPQATQRASSSSEAP